MEWKKFDLHHHTSKDLEKTRTEGLKNYKEIIDTFHEKKGSLLAITNHDYIHVEDKNMYDTYIGEKGYKINVLYGVELSFELQPKNGDVQKKTGHLILIFDANQEQCNKMNEEIFNNENIYKKNTPIDPSLEKVVNEIKKLKVRFYAMPHFHKGSENIDFETSEKDYYESIISFDLLESKFDTPNNKKSVKKAVEYIREKTGIEKGICFGTDAHNIDEFKTNLDKKVPWVYSQNNFEGIEQIIRFNKTRVKYGEKPSSIQNYIESIEIDGQTLFFDRGLNTIIGRRGTGKTHLLESIKKAIENQDDNINFSGSRILENDILFMEQNQLTNNITDVLKVAYGDKANVVNIIEETGISDLSLNNEKSLNDLNSLFTTVSEGLLNSAKVITENVQTSKFNKFLTIQNNFANSIEHINIKKKIKDDLSILDSIIKSGSMSPWLNNNIVSLKNILIKLKDSNFVLQDDNKGQIIKKIKDISLDQLNTDNDLISNKFETFSTKSKEHWLSTTENIDSVNTHIKKIAFIYNKYSVEQEISEFTLKDPVSTKQVLKLEDNIQLDYFITEILQTEYKKPTAWTNSIFTFNQFIKFEKRANKKSISELFSVKLNHFIGESNLANLSIGEKHQKLLERILLDNKEVILLDQPDDDLDALTTQEQIISKLEKWNVEKQVIIVSHDPKIVINSDSKKIILANYKGEKEFGEENYRNIDIKDIKENVYKILDAKKHYPYIRFKEYGGYDGNN